MEGAKGTVAVKVQDVLDSDTEEQINLLVELSISKFFSHENIVRCLGVGRTQTLASEQNVKAKVLYNGIFIPSFVFKCDYVGIHCNGIS